MTKKRISPPYFIVIFTYLIILFSILPAQNGQSHWKIHVSYASMAPFFENDQWLVTPEGYHLHPRTENYTPGLNIGLEHAIFNKVGMEVNFCYGFFPATLGIIDQLSPSGREFLETGRFHFCAILLNPKLYALHRRMTRIYVSPVIGYGYTTEKKMTPSFGPQVIWLNRQELIYGLKGGFSIGVKKPHLFFTAEIVYLSMHIRLKESQYDHTLKEKLGPMGILLGISYEI